MPLTAAASVSVARVLTGPIRTVRVTAALPTALYVSTLDADTPAVCLAAADAVRVPCALVLGPGVAVPTALVGDPAWLGEGQLRLARCGPSVAVTRWWRPVRPRVELLSPAALERAISSVVVAVADFYAVHRTTVDVNLIELAAALASGTPEALAGPVRSLLGRGPGLTPLGDDVLAGALVTLSATGHPAAAPLAASVASALAARPHTATTGVSAALLVHAGRGECVPQLAGVLEAAAGTSAGTLVSAVTELLRVGHSSGGGLLLGVRVGWEASRNPHATADRTPHHPIGRSAG